MVELRLVCFGAEALRTFRLKDLVERLLHRLADIFAHSPGIMPVLQGLRDPSVLVATRHRKARQRLVKHQNFPARLGLELVHLLQRAEHFPNGKDLREFTKHVERCLGILGIDCQQSGSQIRAEPGEECAEAPDGLCPCPLAH